MRFLDINEPEIVATILDYIFVEGAKIHVNLPWFKRELKPEDNPKEGTQQKEEPKNGLLRKTHCMFGFRRFHLLLIKLKALRSKLLNVIFVMK